MAAIDFPNSPTLNQEFTANGRTWIWNGTVWATKVSNTSVSRYNVSDTAPSSPASGDVWFNSTNARTYVYYDSFWVESNPALDGKSGVSAVASPITNSGTQSSAILGLDYSSLQYGQNKIINGAFDHWQRGTSFGVNTYTADRWALTGAGASTESLTRQSFTPGSAPVAGYESQYFARYTRTATGGDSYFLQRVEDARTFAGQTVTLSYWAKASANTTISQVYASAYMGSGGSGGPGGAGNFSGRAITTAWTRYTETFTLPAMPSSAVFGTGHYVEVVFKLGSGMGNIVVDFWGVQLEAGSVATKFKLAANTIQGELAACERYYWRYAPGIQYKIVSQLGISQGSTQFVTVVNFPVTMRTAPTSIEGSGLYIWQRDYSVSDVDAVISSVQLGYGGNNLCELIANASGLTNKATGFIRTAASNGFIGFNAEL